MDQEDRCTTYGHSRPRVSLEYTMKWMDGQIIKSKRRKRILVCAACGGHIE